MFKKPFFKRLKKATQSIGSQHANLLIWLQLMTLVLILALSVYVSFIFGEYRGAHKALSGLERQTAQLEQTVNDATQRISSLQSSMLRLQSYIFRSEGE